MNWIQRLLGVLGVPAGASMSADIAAVMAALTAMGLQYIEGAVSDVGPAAADFDTDLVEATDTHYDGMLLMFTDGDCAGQAHVIDAYLGANGNCAFSAEDRWTEAPGDGDNFIILPDVGVMAKAIYARIGAPAGASMSADIAAIKLILDTPANFKANVAALALEASLGTHDTDIKALLNAIAGYIDSEVHPRVMGRLQIASASWDGRLGDGAGSDVLLTATDQAVVVEAVIVIMAAAPDLTDDPWTGISVEDDYGTTPHAFIPAANGVKANLTANAQLAWNGEVYLASGRSIQATAIGDDADADASITVVALYRAVVSGGYLA